MVEYDELNGTPVFVVLDSMQIEEEEDEVTVKTCFDEAVCIPKFMSKKRDLESPTNASSNSKTSFSSCFLELNSPPPLPARSHAVFSKFLTDLVERNQSRKQGLTEASSIVTIWDDLSPCSNPQSTLALVGKLSSHKTVLFSGRPWVQLERCAEDGDEREE